TDFPNFDALTPVHTQVDSQVNLPSVGSGFDGFNDLNDDFAVRWTGYAYVATAGNVSFSTTSDDGSRLYIDNQLVVNNGGIHGMSTSSGTIALSAGFHA